MYLHVMVHVTGAVKPVIVTRKKGGGGGEGGRMRGGEGRQGSGSRELLSCLYWHLVEA